MENLKFVVLGEACVGKTSLLYMQTSNYFPGEWQPGIYDNFNQNIMFEGRPYNVNYWDTAGQEDYDRLRPLSYPQTDVFIMCFSLDRRQTFTSLEHRFYPEVLHHCGPSKFVLAGLRSDLLEDAEAMARMQARGEAPITEQEIQRLASVLDAPYFEVSSLQNKGVNELFMGALEVGVHGSTNLKHAEAVLKKLGLSNRPVKPIIPPEPQFPPLHSNFRNDMLNMFKSKLYSDMVIVVSARNKELGKEKEILSQVDIPCHLFVVEQCPKLFEFCQANAEIETVNQKKRKKVSVAFDYPEFYPRFLEYLYTYHLEPLLDAIFTDPTTYSSNLDDPAPLAKSLANLAWLTEYLPDVAYQFKVRFTQLVNVPLIKERLEKLSPDDLALKFRGHRSADEILAKFTVDPQHVVPLLPHPFHFYFRRKPRSIVYDVSFSADYKNVDCHWAMLCARSGFFAAMKEGTEDIVELDENNKLLNIPLIKKMSSSAILLELMEYIYTDNIDPEFNSIYSLFDLRRNATFFMLDHLKGLIERRIALLLDPVNVLIVWKIAVEDQLPILTQFCKHRICQFYDEIVKQNLPSFDEETRKFASNAFAELKYPTSREILMFDLYSDCMKNNTLPPKNILKNLENGVPIADIRKDFEKEKCVIQ